MPSKSILTSAAVALAVAALAGPAAADGNANGRSRATSELEGAWRTTITPYVCATGVPLTAAAFDSYLTFGAGGTLVETTSNASFLPGQRSPGHGFWERAGHRSYDASFQAFVQFPGGTFPPCLALTSSSVTNSSPNSFAATS